MGVSSAGGGGGGCVVDGLWVGAWVSEGWCRCLVVRLVEVNWVVARRIGCFCRVGDGWVCGWCEVGGCVCVVPCAWRELSGAVELGSALQVHFDGSVFRGCVLSCCGVYGGWSGGDRCSEVGF